MKKNQVGIILVVLGLAIFQAKASFSSVYVFGDALSTTTNNSYGMPGGSETKLYYGGRYSNGRIWAEVLAQRLGTTISYNWSYYGCGSSNMFQNVSSLSISPSVASNTLFVLWCNNADLFNEVVNSQGSTNQASWTWAITNGVNYELNTILSLTNKGVRTLVMPSVVDVSEVPFFSQDYKPSFLQFFRAQCVTYNTAFSNMLNQARAECPGLTIYEPNFFALLYNVLSNAPAYGLTNVLLNSLTYDALDALGNNANTNGLGANYVYWNSLNPTAKFHEIMADTTMQMIAPAQINGLAIQGALTSVTTNQLFVSNVPVGLPGFVDGYESGITNSTSWAVVTNFTGTVPTQSLFVVAPPQPPFEGPSGNGSILPGSPSNGGSSSSTGTTNAVSAGEMLSYRLRFPFSWQWP